MLRSPVIRKLPIWPLARQCVPPHSSWLKPSTRIVRTRSPYFSSKNASAPAAWASAIVIHSIDTGRSSRTIAPDLGLDRALLVVGQRAVEREVEAQVVGVDERARLPRRFADDVAQRPVQQVRAGVVAHRVGAALGIDLGRARVSPTRDLAVQHARGGRSEPGRLGAGDALDVVDRANEHASPSADRSDARCPRPGRRSRRRTGCGRGSSSARAAASVRSSTSGTASSVSYSTPSRRIATTRPSAIVVS